MYCSDGRVKENVTAACFKIILPNFTSVFSIAGNMRG
jgi:hypothetical protein